MLAKCVLSTVLLAAFAADPAPVPVIKFPAGPAVPTPAPAPGGVYVIAGELLYVIECKVDCVLKASPAKLVTVRKMKGPVTIFAKFADGSGGLETRSYDAPCLFAVQAAGVGQVDLFVIPYGFKSDSEIESRTVMVDNGMPRPPPPKPIPDPVIPDPVIPDPPTPAPDAQLVATFKLALDQDIAAKRGTKAKAADLAVVFESGAGLLSIDDPAIAPRTVGDLYSKMVLSSVAKGIPRLPYLQSTRAVVEANTPLLNGTTAMTPELKAQFQAAYRKVAAALTEASK